MTLTEYKSEYSGAGYKLRYCGKASDTYPMKFYRVVTHEKECGLVAVDVRHQGNTP